MQSKTFQNLAMTYDTVYSLHTVKCRNFYCAKILRKPELSGASFDNVTLLKSFGIPSHQQVDEYAKYKECKHNLLSKVKGDDNFTLSGSELQKLGTVSGKV